MTDAGWPTFTLATSLSLNPAFTWSPPESSVIVMNPDEVPDDDRTRTTNWWRQWRLSHRWSSLVSELDDPVLEDDDPPPDTLSPTAAVTADTVPACTAYRVVSSSVFCALATFDCADTTYDCADTTDDCADASEAGLPSWAVSRLISAVVNWFCAFWIDW